MEYKLRKETEHFTIWYDTIDSDIAKEYSILIENTYTLICNNFGFIMNKETGKFQFYICKSVEDYLYFTNKKKEDYKDWMVGWSDYSLRRLCLLSPKVVSGFHESELKKVIIHELVHAIFDDYCKVIDNEAWLSEGIAILYANQTDLEYISTSDYPKINDISGKCKDGDTPENFYNNNGYDYAGIYVWYFISQYGFDMFIDAYKNNIDINTIIEVGFEKEAIDKYIGTL